VRKARPGGHDEPCAYYAPAVPALRTLWILFIAYLTKEMPVGYSQSDATFRGIHPELEEAGRILGAGRLRVLREIHRALAKSGIIATWCFIFIGVIRELSPPSSSSPPNTKVMSVVIFDLKEEGQFGDHRRPRPLHARHDLRPSSCSCRPSSAATSWARGNPARRDSRMPGVTSPA